MLEILGTLIVQTQQQQQTTTTTKTNERASLEIRYPSLIRVFCRALCLVVGLALGIVFLVFLPFLFTHDRAPFVLTYHFSVTLQTKSTRTAGASICNLILSRQGF